MNNKDPRAKGMPWLSPYLIVKDVRKTIEFYTNVFRFETMGEPIDAPDGTLGHAELCYKDSVVMIGAEGGWKGTTKTPANSGIESPINLYIYVDAVDAFAAHVRTQGVELTEPEDMFWGDRMCKVTDIDGYTWTFATNVGECDLSKMPKE